MKILVTGSNGCVGSALKSLCNNDPNWIFIERRDCDLINREQTINFFKDIKADYIVHLASYVPGFYDIRPTASFSDNVRINENVLEASNLSKIQKGLFCLSVNMFAEKSIKFPINEGSIFEGHLTGNFAGYAYSKRMLAMQCANYNSQYNKKYFGIIPSNIYGPNDNLQSGRLMPNLITKFEESKKNNLDVVINGSGKPLRQFIYSNDIAKIIKYLIHNYDDTKPIICCGDEEISIENLANTIGSIMEFKNKIKFDISKPDGVLKKTVSNLYLKTIMPNFEFTSLNIGLQEIINKKVI